MVIVDTATGLNPEAAFASEIDEFTEVAEDCIANAQATLEPGRTVDIVDFWDSADIRDFDAIDGYTGQTIMMSVLQHHEVLDDYYRAQAGERGGNILEDTENNDGN